MDVEDVDSKTKAALAHSLVSMIEEAIDSLPLRTITDVKCLLRGMKEAAEEVMNS